MAETKLETGDDNGGKKKRKRRASQYMVLRSTEAIVTSDSAKATVYVQVAEGKSPKDCEKAIRDGLIVGELLVCCVRRRVTTAKQEVLKFE